MNTPLTQYVHLAPRPDSAYRQMFIKGTRIPARALYGWYACDDPMTAEEIAESYNLPVAAVLEAIDYCQSNPRELTEDYARQEVLMKAMGVDDPDYDGRPKPITPQDRAQIGQG